MKTPDFADPIEWHDGYKYSVIEQDACKHNLDFAIKAFKNPSEALDAPQSSIYPRDDVHLGSKSTLVCFSTRFFPPPVRIRWTRNGLNVTDESTLSQYYPNKDNTYNQFSHLPFTPQEGDVYTCTVEHKALQIPKTITWVEPQVKVRSVKKSDGSHPAMLICTAYNFYPKFINVTWLRNGQKIKGDVTSTEKMANGDWYYQIHSHLQYMPESGEEISCVVEHASLKKPIIYKWDPSMRESDKKETLRTDPGAHINTGLYTEKHWSVY
ncbi:hypothetical protein HF521_006577 [Silurus meridionalis]|uniref:Ig-like domain-containing protein n=1 Tax=Silurus meridionalis TaxID=175797 RepID=A0A8T0ANZ1_SILME|nr:hypothetical protein HF521_006577 [Silurus meridionalis]